MLQTYIARYQRPLRQLARSVDQAAGARWDYDLARWFAEAEAFPDRALTMEALRPVLRALQGLLLCQAVHVSVGDERRRQVLHISGETYDETLEALRDLLDCVKRQDAALASALAAQSKEELHRDFAFIRRRIAETVGGSQRPGAGRLTQGGPGAHSAA